MSEAPNHDPKSGESSSPPPRPKPVACPSCGKPNPRNEDWCWVCYAELTGAKPYEGEARPTVDRAAARRARRQRNERRHEDERTRRRLSRSRVANVLLGTAVAVSVSVAVVAIAVACFVISVIAAFFEACTSIVGG